MDADAVTALLRPGLLAGRTIAVAGGAEGPAAACAALGAATPALTADPADEQAAATAAAALGRVDALVCDARPAWAAAGGGEAGLRAAVDAAFLATRVVAEAWIAAPNDDGRGGKVVLVAPAPGSGPQAGAPRAALENLARTLTTEWARFGITVVAVLPGEATAPGDVGALCAYLVSEAGAYVAGTALTLGGSSPARP
jgi:NAD(P)-dependent dehydrogenase (short-subunit alcohol dehydrogenase family)